jgi:phosphotransferase system HPr-like phosphotransfer protein
MAKPKDKSSLIQDITNRYSVTAREARDIVTSVGTFLKTVKNVKPSQGGGTPTAKSMRAINAAGSDVVKQIRETGSAATSGKTGTTAAQSKVKREVIPGTKRK